MRTVDRLFTKPIKLYARTEGGEDDWGSPIMTETVTETVCYYRLMRTGDADEGGEVLWEVYEVFLPADTVISPYHAVELDDLKMEVIGRPDPEWNARTASVNHVKLRVRRGES